MNIKTKLILGIGMLAGMIILLVTLSVVNLQILTATEPDSPAAMPGLERALLWISVTGGICILTGLILLYWLPRTISKPIKELKEGISFFNSLFLSGCRNDDLHLFFFNTLVKVGDLIIIRIIFPFVIPQF